jgi:peptidoglycan/LPS O-acetylase OafA/YrhL
MLVLSVLFTVLLRYSSHIPNGLFIFDSHNKKLVGDFVVSSLFALMISIFHKFDAHLIASKLLQPIRFCGIMCYSLYLVHWPIANGLSHAFYLAGIKGLWPTLLITVPVTIAASVWLSWLFYLAVERYFLNSPVAISPNVNTRIPNAVLAGD